MPAPSVSRSMADEAPIRLLLLDGPMANVGRMKPAFRTFFPAAITPSRRRDGDPDDAAPRA